MSHEACIANEIKISPQMELAGVAALEDLSESLDSYSLVKAVYTAMARSSPLALSRVLQAAR